MRSSMYAFIHCLARDAISNTIICYFTINLLYLLYLVYENHIFRSWMIASFLKWSLWNENYFLKNILKINNVKKIIIKLA